LWLRLFYEFIEDLYVKRLHGIFKSPFHREKKRTPWKIDASTDAHIAAVSSSERVKRVTLQALSVQPKGRSPRQGTQQSQNIKDCFHDANNKINSSSLNWESKTSATNADR